MRESMYVLAISLALAFGLSGCGKDQQQQATSSSQARIVKPANPKDTVAWRNYMGQVADPPSHATAERPYKFLVPSGNDPAAAEQRKQVQDALGSMAAANSFPGNVIAVGGPDPAKSADVIVAAFAMAKPASLQKLTVLYIGDQANQSRAQKVVVASGAQFHYSQM